MKKLIPLFVITLFLWPVSQGYGAFLYKNYIIRQDKGTDILCDPYIVRKDDWVIKIFQRRGQIADQDFPEFLKIFSRLNPNVKNVNKILPGQHILIPLKKLPKGSLPGQSSGLVTIPFVTVSKIPDMVKGNSYTYTVRPGDYVSGIISKTYGKNSNLTYNESIQLFKLINPSITNLDRIYPGQVLNIPDRTLGNKALYDALFSNSGALLNNPELTASKEPPPALPPKTDSKPYQQNPSFVTVASVLDAKLFYQGKYFFPRDGQEDLVIDLSKYPVMELSDGRRVLFSEENDISLDDQAFIQKQWKGIRFVTLPHESKFEKIMDSVLNIASDAESYQNLVFDDNGVKVGIYGKWMVKSGTTKNAKEQNQGVTQPYTFISITYPNDQPVPNSIKRYFARYNIAIKEITPSGESIRKSLPALPPNYDATLDKKNINEQNLKTFVSKFTSAMNFHYAPNTDISFPYAGVQVNAVSNLISTTDGRQLLVDFGDLYGDAVSSIENTGLAVIQLNDKMSPSSIIENMLKKLKIPYSPPPKIFAVNRQNSLEISFEVPGFLYKPINGEIFLITSSPLDDHLIAFLNDKYYKIIVYSEADFSTDSESQPPDQNMPIS